jgi:hypothetical protein
MPKKSVQSTEVIRETENIRVTVLKLSDDAKRGLSTDGAQLRADSGNSGAEKKSDGPPR